MPPPTAHSLPSNIDLRVSATLHHVDFAREDVDLAVRHGHGFHARLGRLVRRRHC
jgi:DNA-binding transcriptional LysR family regulator